MSKENERVYQWWVDACACLASQIAVRPVDVERGLFHLVDKGRQEVAERVLSMCQASLASAT